MLLSLDSGPRTAATDGALSTGLAGDEDLETVKAEAKERLFIDVRKELHLERRPPRRWSQVASKPSAPSVPKASSVADGLDLHTLARFTPDLRGRPASDTISRGARTRARSSLTGAGPGDPGGHVAGGPAPPASRGTVESVTCVTEPLLLHGQLSSQRQMPPSWPAAALASCRGPVWP